MKVRVQNNKGDCVNTVICLKRSSPLLIQRFLTNQMEWGSRSYSNHKQEGLTLSTLGYDRWTPFSIVNLALNTEAHLSGYPSVVMYEMRFGPFPCPLPLGSQEIALLMGRGP